jgi:putative serine protease PepD
VDAAGQSVVQIRSARGLGSDIVFDGDGHVVTNAHVVAAATRFRVTVADGSTHPGTLRGTFPQGDLAVIEVSGAKLRPARFADSDDVAVALADEKPGATIRVEVRGPNGTQTERVKLGQAPAT